jgi:hypothetical protein
MLPHGWNTRAALPHCLVAGLGNILYFGLQITDIEVIVSGNRNQKKKRQQQYAQRPLIASRRKDELTRLLVDMGVQYAPTLGINKAAELLREKNVPEDVIQRVLHRPPKPYKE